MNKLNIILKKKKQQEFGWTHGKTDLRVSTGIFIDGHFTHFNRLEMFKPTIIGSLIRVSNVM